MRFMLRGVHPIVHLELASKRRYNEAARRRSCDPTAGLDMHLLEIGNMPTEDSTTPTCFECDAPADHTHHVVPQSRGGARSVPLCSKCHYHAHHGNGNMTSAALTREGLARAKANGVLLGSARPECRGNLSPDGRVRGLARSAVARKGNAVAAYSDVIGLMRTLRADGSTLAAIADRLNGEGFKTRKGKAWNPTQVMRVLAR